MKNAFNEHISRLDTTKEQVKTFEGAWIQSSQTDMKTETEKINVKAQNCGTFPKHVT